MFKVISAMFQEMIESVQWDVVFMFFTIFMLITIAVFCFLAGLVWACTAKSLWPLLLWIICIFICSIFAAHNL